MNTLKKLVMLAALCALTGVIAQPGLAQEDGYIQTLPEDNGGLPPGAVYENGIVSHPISSGEENLHLLAGYYYRNPRDWKRIYNDNRNIISNPNRLPVGQTLKIHVGENWKPLFSYEEWFQLANRNGQWQSGRRWQPARESSGTYSAPPATPASEPKPVQTTPASTPEPEAAEEAPHVETTAPPAEESEPTAAPVPEDVPEEEEPPQPEETPEPEEEPEEDEEEAGPAF